MDHKTMARIAQAMTVSKVGSPINVGAVSPILLKISMISFPKATNILGKFKKIATKIPKNPPPTRASDKKPIPKIRPTFLIKVLPCLKKMTAPSHPALNGLISFRYMIQPKQQSQRYPMRISTAVLTADVTLLPTSPPTAVPIRLIVWLT